MPEFKVSFWAIDKQFRREGARPVMTKVTASSKAAVRLALEERYDRIEGLQVNPVDYSVYDELVKVMAPNQIDHHESDLYVLRNEKSQPIVEAYVGSVKTFVSNIDHKVWYDLPFAYKPFWEKVSDRAAALTQAHALTPPAPGHFGWKKPKPRLTR